MEAIPASKRGATAQASAGTKDPKDDGKPTKRRKNPSVEAAKKKFRAEKAKEEATKGDSGSGESGSKPKAEKEKESKSTKSEKPEDSKSKSQDKTKPTTSK